MTDTKLQRLKRICEVRLREDQNVLYTEAHGKFLAAFDNPAFCLKLLAVVKAARELFHECEAEFTTDGYWNMDDALVTRKTCKSTGAALAALDQEERDE